jgi:hypothetical protein
VSGLLRRLRDRIRLELRQFAADWEAADPKHHPTVKHRP